MLCGAGSWWVKVAGSHDSHASGAPPPEPAAPGPKRTLRPCGRSCCCAFIPAITTRSGAMRCASWRATSTMLSSRASITTRSTLVRGSRAALSASRWRVTSRALVHTATTSHTPVICSSSPRCCEAAPSAVAITARRCICSPSFSRSDAISSSLRSSRLCRSKASASALTPPSSPFEEVASDTTSGDLSSDVRDLRRSERAFLPPCASPPSS
mmetsp:Transcript_7669/g.23400  ORF Transcript_7669/g.23400 Transcript_7669/m.23400 type:complete len:212 (-) Transcript_7669:2946-3581(-)